MKIEQILKNYSEVEDRQLREGVTVIEKKPLEKRETYGIVYTDGSSRGHAGSGDGCGFGGCGYVLVVESSGGGVKEFSSYTGMFNTDNHQAELQAALNAITSIRVPMNLRLVTDSSYVLKGISNLKQMLDEKKFLDSIPYDKRTGAQKRNLVRLRLWENLSESLASPNLLSLKVDWVRAHVLDDMKVKPSPSEGQNSKERGMILDWIGNGQADSEARKGVISQIKKVVWNLSKDSNDREKMSRYIGTCRKNFKASRASRLEAVNILKEYKEWFLSKPIVLSVFGKEVYEELSKIYGDRKLKSGYEPVDPSGTKLDPAAFKLKIQSEAEKEVAINRRRPEGGGHSMGL